jgi:MFS family permease
VVESFLSSSGPLPGTPTNYMDPRYRDTDMNRGILIQYFIQYGASFVDGGPKAPNQGTSAFRIPWGISAVPGVILLLGLFFFPRSPRWLASKDRWEEALQVLGHLHGGGDQSHPKVLAEYKEIEDALRFEREQAETSFGALMKPRILKRVILGMSIQMWSQLCGMYMTRVFSVPSKRNVTACLVVISSFYPRPLRWETSC